MISTNTRGLASTKFVLFAVCLFSLLLLVGGFTQQTVAQTVTSGDITGTCRRLRSRRGGRGSILHQRC